MSGTTPASLRALVLLTLCGLSTTARADEPDAGTTVLHEQAESAEPVHSEVPLHEHEHEHTLVHSHAHDHPHAEPGYGATARARQEPRAASTRVFTRRELPRGAGVQAEDLLRIVPGLFVVQHAGGGKANQYFLRGFDIDHGTDLALSVDGVPVNMVSHGHGQGYADMHWIIPELIERMEVVKGSYDPRFGDFATAGAVDLQTSSVAPESRVTVQGGMFRTYRGLGVVGTEIDRLSITGAAEVYGTDGPFDHPQDLGRYSLFARAAHPLAGGDLSLTTTAYGSSWDASGQIPLRAVRAGALDRFGAIDPLEGGSSSRHSVYARYRSGPSLPQRWELLGYLVSYRFSLYSDFTFLRDDPVRGDMIHQDDSRLMSGFKARYQRDDRLGPFVLASRFGFELRSDQIRNHLERAPARELGERLTAARIGESGIGAFVEEEIEWLSWLRTSAAARLDRFDFAVRDALEDRESEGTRTSGERARTRVSPKASLVIAPRRWLELYGNLGYGFHSNDARGVVQGVTALTRALGYEIGARTRPTRWLSAQLVAFRLDLDSELVWVGDEGTTEPSGRTRREGLEAELRVAPLDWLVVELSATWTHARFRDVPAREAAVPLAPRRLIAGSLTAQHPTGLFGRLSVLHVGDRPATEDSFLTAQGFTRADLSVGYRHPRFELSLRLENLLDAAFRESQFATVSRLASETAAGACAPGTRAVSVGGSFQGCEDIHFTPGTPFSAQASASLFF